MIFYFSGTGNSRWVARQLAEMTGDEAYDIITLEQVPDLRGEARIGFVFPVYAWGPPEVMAQFAQKLTRTQAFAFGICTCGGDAGLTMKAFSKCYPLDSCYSLVMPNNYIIGSQPDDPEVIRRKIADARQELGRIAQEILERKPVYRVHQGSLAGVKSRFANFGFNRFARSVKPFFVTEACVGCGLCEKHCPASAISLQNGKPLWKDPCYQCLRCINECPQEAIQYGKSTAGRRRYVFPQELS